MPPLPPPLQAPPLPPISAVLPYDEMRAPGGKVRPHYEALDARIATLSSDELSERQRTELIGLFHR